MGVDGWARTALVALVMVIMLLLIYLFSNRLWLRKTGFFGAIFLLAVFLFSNLFAWQQQQACYTARTGCCHHCFVGDC